jgi:hypothetical protein
MNHLESPNRNWMPLAAGVFSVWILAAIFTSLCLYADGAHEFVRVLEAQDFAVFMWSRHFAFWIYQFPLVLAIKLGVTRLPLLRFAFGLGCFLPWPLALLLCRWISPENFWLAVAGCAAGYLNAATPAISEHILAHAMFWPALFVLLFARPLKMIPALILLAMSVGLQFSYESQIFLCCPLAGLALWRSIQERRAGSGWPWGVCFAAAALFLASMANGVCSVLMPELPGNFIGFKTNTLGILRHTGWTVDWTLLWCGLAVSACLSEKIRRFLSGKTGRCLLAAAVLVWGTGPLLAPGKFDTGLPYDNRVLNLLVPLALLPVALILRFRPAWLESGRSRLVQLTAMMLLAQSLWQLSITALWYRDVIWMQETLAAKRGIFPLRSTVLAADGMLGCELHPDAIGGRFDWTWPCLSLALAPGKQINCLICSEVFMDPMVRRHYWQPFDPFKPETLPRLNHYGLDYSNYIAALNGQNVK